jgi:putative DNA primase/helicase
MNKNVPDGVKILSAEADRWCAWKLVPGEKEGKAKKIPCGKQGAIGVNDPNKWMSFADAWELFDNGGRKYAGVGLLMTSTKEIVCIDIDNCLDEAGNVVESERELVQEVMKWDSYVEVSQSGQGLHVFIRAKKPENTEEKGTTPGEHSLEIYGSDSVRYIAVTGKRWRGMAPEKANEIRSRQAEL